MVLNSYSIKVEKSEKFEDYLILSHINNYLIGYCGFVIRGDLAIGKLSKDIDFLSKFMIDDDLRYSLGGLSVSLFVKEKFRGKKLGEKLILDRINFLKRLKISKLFVESNGKFEYHNQLYKDLDAQKIVNLENTDSKTFHYLTL